jgi:3-oxoacyl-[acyl-carrier-protein] synthase-3
MRMKTRQGTRATVDSGESPAHLSRLESIGVRLPEARLSTADLMASCRRTVRLDLEKLTGIRERRVCTNGEDSLSLAVEAARDCLKHSDYRAEELEMVISCSITRFSSDLTFQYEPPLSLAIKEAIGARQALNFDVTNACAGMLTGVLILDDFIRRGAVRRGMVVSGEYISSLGSNATRDMWTVASAQMASLTLGDAGAAVILERAEAHAGRVHSIELTTVAKYDDLCIGRPRARGPGASMFTKPRTLQRVAIAESLPVLLKACARAGLSAKDINSYVPHQTSIRAIRSGIKYLAPRAGVSPPKHVAITVDEYGNTASTSIFLALYEQLEQRRFAQGDILLLLCFASGLVVGGALLTIDEMRERYGRDH